MRNRDDQLIIVMDNTYLYLQKSSNNELERRSFSTHNHRNLIKPMTITATVNVFVTIIFKIFKFEKAV